MYELYGKRHELLATNEDVLNLVVSSVVSGVIGYASIAFLLNFLRKYTTYVFIVYRLLLGAGLLMLLEAGRLAATR